LRQIAFYVRAIFVSIKYIIGADMNQLRSGLIGRYGRISGAYGIVQKGPLSAALAAVNIGIPRCIDYDIGAEMAGELDHLG